MHLTNHGHCELGEGCFELIGPCRENLCSAHLVALLTIGIVLFSLCWVGGTQQRCALSREMGTQDAKGACGSVHFLGVHALEVRRAAGVFQFFDKPPSVFKLFF